MLRNALRRSIEEFYHCSIEMGKLFFGHLACLYIPNYCYLIASEMCNELSYFIINILSSKYHIQLGPDDSMSFPAVYGANKVNCSCSLDHLYVAKIVLWH